MYHEIRKSYHLCYGSLGGRFYCPLDKVGGSFWFASQL